MNSYNYIPYLMLLCSLSVSQSVSHLSLNLFPLPPSNLNLFIG